MSKCVASSATVRASNKLTAAVAAKITHLAERF
jgi:hypothetical protein